MYIEDTLEPDDGRYCYAGWLDTLHPFTKGEVPPSFFARLLEHAHAQRSWQPAYAMGSHECELCVRRRVRESLNLWIPTPDALHYAPMMIVHYIESHMYRPPDPFIDAVMSCPLAGTEEFERAFAPYALPMAPEE